MLKMGKDTIEVVAEITYIGGKITRGGRSRHGVKNRLTLANRDFFQKKSLLIANISL